MEQTPTGKIYLSRSNILKHEKRLLFPQGALIFVFALCVTVFSLCWTAGTIAMYSKLQLAFWLVDLAINVALLIFSGFLIFAAAKINLSLFCLLTKRYTLEQDRVQEVELRVQNNREYRRTLFGSTQHPDFYTYQYVYFENCGVLKSEVAPAFAQDETYYVLVTRTKKPMILRYWSCEKYEIVDQ